MNFRSSSAKDNESQLNALRALASDPPTHHINFGDVQRVAPKIGGHYGTPFGLYAYPLNTWIMNRLENGLSLYSIEKEFISILKPRGKMLDLSSYSQAELDRDVESLESMGFQVPKVEGSPGSQIYEITRIVTDGSQNELKWSKLLKRLGYSGINDQGDGIIYNEPSQLSQSVFFDTGSYEVIKTDLNRLWFYRGESANNAVKRAETLYEKSPDEAADFVESLKPSLRSAVMDLVSDEMSQHLKEILKLKRIACSLV